MSKREDLAVNQITTPAGNSITFGASVPTTGTHKVGDVVINTAPTAGGVFAWACTTAGTPGVWKAVSLAV